MALEDSGALPTGTIAIWGSDSGRATEIVAEFTELGIDVIAVTSPQDIADPAIVGVVDLRSLNGSALTAEAALERTADALVLAREVDARAEDLSVVVLTSIDGRHGLGGGIPAVDAPVQAAGIGFWKCAAKEWRHHRVRCLDIAVDVDAATVARHVARDLAGDVPGDDLEHGLDNDGLWLVGLEAVEAGGRAALAPDAVVLAIGGAQGIGAEILDGAVASPGRTLVLAGRTDPDAVVEPPGLASARTEAEIRDAVIADVRASGERPVPAEIGRVVRSIVGARRVRTTIERLEATGATVEYHPLDARDPAAVGALVADVIGRHGRLDLVVHAAGVIADAPVARKDPASVEAVLSTKTIPALALCEAVGDSTTVVFFGSVAGRFGNAAQADYGAGNEFLAKLAACRRAAGADVRCLAWGPWDSGMVSPGLLAVYDTLGVVPIAVAAGVEAFARELTDQPGIAEVVLANSTRVMAGLRWPPSAASILGS